jgi:hypothetical protein
MVAIIDDMHLPCIRGSFYAGSITLLVSLCKSADRADCLQPDPALDAAL